LIVTTATTTTLAQEYERLTYEQRELDKAVHEGAATPEARKRRRAVTQRLREIAATAPPGYALPKAATDLIAHAEAHGWMALVTWTSPGYSGEPSVSVRVGRLVHAADGYVGLGDRWKFERTWHSRGCAPGKVRMFGNGHAVTPANPGGNYAPSVKAIRAVIEQHPAPVA
jgi:hypothetical protein